MIGIGLSLPAAVKRIGGIALGVALAAGAGAQSDGALRRTHPELARLLNAFDVTQAAVYEAMAEINAAPSARQARMELRMELDMANSMDAMDHRAMGHGAMDMGVGMNMDGPYGELEAQARRELNGVVRGGHSDAAAAGAFRAGGVLPRFAADVIGYGRRFENRLLDIWAEPGPSVADKRAASARAVEDYLVEEPRLAVSAAPKSAELYLAHDHANGMKSAYPRLNGLLWTNQWLTLAALEAMILGQVDPQFAGRVPATLERYYGKLGSDTGMSMFPPPTEMPTAPAIAPQLYSQSPQAAVIIDNLNMLEAAAADILAYPDLDDRGGRIDAAAAEFASAAAGTDDEMGYLLSALRGGIFNQGGPAVGELGRSERNRSRAAMDMRHAMIMSSPN